MISASLTVLPRYISLIKGGLQKNDCNSMTAGLYLPCEREKIPFAAGGQDMNSKPANFEKVRDFIRKVSREERGPFGLTEAVRATGLPKTSVDRYLNALTEEGVLKRSGRMYLTAQQARIFEGTRAVPFCGKVSCGLPRDTALAPESYEMLSLPASLLGRGEYFLLEAEGESMIEDGIREGDWLLIRAQSVPDYDGQIVVAMAGGETLLKHIHIDREAGYTELIPANSSMHSVKYRHGTDEDVEVQGVAVMKLSYL